VTAPKRRFDFIPGTDQEPLILLILALAIGFVASQGWRESAWAQAAATAGPAAGGVIYGKKKGERQGFEEGEDRGFERGYWTPNPAITPEERGGGIVARVADNMAQGVVSGVTGAVADRAADMAVEQLQGIWPSGEDDQPAPSPELQQQHDPREVRRAKPKLPDGWRIDGRGRIRDNHGRIASDERRRRSLRGQ
jgi:hypothetical protein